MTTITPDLFTDDLLMSLGVKFETVAGHPVPDDTAEATLEYALDEFVSHAIDAALTPRDQARAATVGATAVKLRRLLNRCLTDQEADPLWNGWLLDIDRDSGRVADVTIYRGARILSERLI